VYRSFIAFDPSVLAGKYINSASLTLRETASYSCSASQLDLYAIQSPGQVPVYWNNQPPEGALYASISTAKGYSTSCAEGDVVLTDGGADGSSLRDLVELWTMTAAPPGFELRADNESDPNGAKIFRSSDASSGRPVLSVTYEDDPCGPAVLDQQENSTTGSSIPDTWDGVQYATGQTDESQPEGCEFSEIPYRWLGTRTYTVTGTPEGGGSDTCTIKGAD
jgi:hypothetical protein